MSGNCKCGLRVEGKDIEVPLKESKIQVTVQEFMANVECQLTYVNEGPDPLQTSFVFPMDDMSAVYKFEAHVNKKHIIAECQDKKKAKKTYDEAIASGHTAMLLSEDDTAGDIFECKIGNLPAGETALLTMGFIAELSVEPEGKMRFTLPTVLNPRYFPEVGHLVVAGSAPSPGQVNIKTPCKLIFSSSVSGRHKINAVTSSNDKFNVTISDDKLSAVIELAEEFKFDHDLSLDIVYNDITKPVVILELGDRKKDGLLKEDVIMLNLYPDLKQEEMEDSKREFIFVIDRSDSMDGHRIQRAKETLLLLLKSLPVECFFNVVSFGSSHSSLFDQSQEYSEYTLQQAIDLQKTMDSDMGGTEILEPLKSIYSNSCKQGYPRQIFLLTDGEVGNTDDVVSLVRKNNGNTRVFTFGIGDGVSTSLIKNVAKASKGKAIFIKDKDNMQAKVIARMKGSLKRCLSEIQLHWDIPKCFSVIDIPSEPPVVFHREKLVLFALLRSKDNKKGVTGKLNLKGTFGGKTVSYSTNIETPSSSHPDLPLHRMAAKYQIKDLEVNDEGSYHRDGVNKDKIILVSQAANIVSKYTAFVGVDKDTKVPVSTIKDKPEYVRPSVRRLHSSTRASLALCSEPASKGMPLDICVPSMCLKMPEYECMSQAEGIDNGDEDIMMKIVSLQNFDGSWSPSKELKKILQINEKEQKTHFKDNIWCTATVLVFLEKNFSKRHTEWEMIKNKAIKWMTSQDRDGKTVGEILQEVKESV